MNPATRCLKHAAACGPVKIQRSGGERVEGPESDSISESAQRTRSNVRISQAKAPLQRLEVHAGDVRIVPGRGGVAE